MTGFTLPPDARTVRVALPGREYDIVIGANLLGMAGRLISHVASGARCAIVTDENVARHHLPALTAALQGMLIGPPHVLPSGEATKSFNKLALVCGHLLDLKLERGDVVIAFGGGVIGDLAGFAAAILKRGIRFIQIPTTLLAQVDSSVGGKTGINAPQGKNLIGAFHQPSLVIADTDALTTLPGREFRAGYAEVAKYGLLGDAAFFAWLEANIDAVFSGEGSARSEAIERSCQAKAAIVLEDEHETGRRALLNLGHTFGHALEAWAGFDGSLIHGEAISIGMALAFQFSARESFCSHADASRAVSHFIKAGLPTRLNDLQRLTGKQPPDTTHIIALMEQDKKVMRGAHTLILARSIGEAFINRDVAIGRLTHFLDEARRF
ncbi:MAG: 3-dehydroquinate synthase [Hyphomicrobiales bacterium]|nr:3-dehydroquinate synthase [Hyphomicrobiales bacterium]